LSIGEETFNPEEVFHLEAVTGEVARHPKLAITAISQGRGELVDRERPRRQRVGRLQ